RDDAVRVAWIRDAEGGIALVGTFLRLEALVSMVARRRHHNHAAVAQPLTFGTNRRGAAREISHVMRYRQTEIGAVDAEIVVAVVDIADVLQHGDDRELGVLHRRTEDAKVPEVDVRAHSILDV